MHRNSDVLYLHHPKCTDADIKSGVIDTVTLSLSSDFKMSIIVDPSNRHPNEPSNTYNEETVSQYEIGLQC